MTLLTFHPPPSVPIARLAGATDPLSAAYNITALAHFHARRGFRPAHYATQSHEQRGYEDDVESSDDPPEA